MAKASPAIAQDKYALPRANLLCAEGLPGAGVLDVEACLQTLDRWSEGVKRFVQDSRPQFERNPAEYQHQEGFFCFLSMVTLLKHPRGLGVGYQPREMKRGRS